MTVNKLRFSSAHGVHAFVRRRYTCRCGAAPMRAVIDASSPAEAGACSSVVIRGGAGAPTNLANAGSHTATGDGSSATPLPGSRKKPLARWMYRRTPHAIAARWRFPAEGEFKPKAGFRKRFWNARGIC